MNDILSRQITICPEIHLFDACDNNLTKGLFRECFHIFSEESYGYALKCKYTFLKLLHTIICAENEQAHSKVGRAIKFIEANYLDEIPVAELARMCNLGECMFRRSFKAETGISPLNTATATEYSKLMTCWCLSHARLQGRWSSQAFMTLHISTKPSRHT